MSPEWRHRLPFLRMLYAILSSTSVCYFSDFSTCAIDCPLFLHRQIACEHAPIWQTRTWYTHRLHPHNSSHASAAKKIGTRERVSICLAEYSGRFGLNKWVHWFFTIYSAHMCECWRLNGSVRTFSIELSCRRQRNACCMFKMTFLYRYPQWTRFSSRHAQHILLSFRFQFEHIIQQTDTLWCHCSSAACKRSVYCILYL